MSDPLTDDFLPGETPGRLTRAELRSDVGVAWRLVVVLVVAGLPLGALWTLLTPVERVVVLSGGASGTPNGEGAHAFDAVAVFVLLLAAFGTVAGAVAWRRRSRRGPVLMGAAALGSAAAGVVAWLVATWLAPTGAPLAVTVDRAAASGGEVTGPPVAAALTSVPPSPGPWWVVLVAGLAAALTYVIAAILEGHEDMSRDEV